MMLIDISKYDCDIVLELVKEFNVKLPNKLNDAILNMTVLETDKNKKIFCVELCDWILNSGNGSLWGFELWKELKKDMPRKMYDLGFEVSLQSELNK